jgi:hypothetical protein
MLTYADVCRHPQLAQLYLNTAMVYLDLTHTKTALRYLRNYLIEP